MAKRKDLVESVFDGMDTIFNNLDKSLEALVGSLKRLKKPSTRIRVSIKPSQMAELISGKSLIFGSAALDAEIEIRRIP